MIAKIVLETYPPYLTPDKWYTLKGQSQIDQDLYFVVTDDGPTTAVLTSQLIFLEEARDFKIQSLLQTLQH